MGSEGSGSRCRGLAIALALGLLSGCGATGLSGSQLRSRATSLCLQATRQASRVPTPTSPAGAATFFKRGIDVLGPELAALRTLRPPGSAAAVYATALNDFHSKLSALGETVRDLASGEDPVIATKGVEQLLARVESQEDRAWQALGVPACVDQ